MAECDENAEEAKHLGEILVEVSVFQKPESFLTKFEILRSWQRHGLIWAFKKRQHRPGKQDHNHDGRDLHNSERLFAGLLNAFGVLPPVINGDNQCKEC